MAIFISYLENVFTIDVNFKVVFWRKRIFNVASGSAILIYFAPYNITLMNIIGMNHIWLRNGIYPCRQLTLIVSFHTSLKDGWDEYLIEQRPSISKDAGLW